MGIYGSSITFVEEGISSGPLPSVEEMSLSDESLQRTSGIVGETYMSMSGKEGGSSVLGIGTGYKAPANNRG